MPASDGFEQAVTIEPGHGDIAQDEMRADRFQHVQRFTAISCTDRVIACSGKFIDDVLAKMALVLNTENRQFRTGFGHRLHQLLFEPDHVEIRP